MSFACGFVGGFLVAGFLFGKLNEMYLDLLAEGIVNGFYCGDKWQKRVCKAVRDAKKAGEKELEPK